jgi:hypothetical protein
MLSHPPTPEIDQKTMKLIVGIIALSLASLTSFYANGSISSISAAYYEEGASADIFVGFLFAISAFLLAYNGYSAQQMVCSKIAAIAGLCIALFPCRCETHTEIIPHVHGLAATVMFGILAFFCRVFHERARGKGAHGRRRAAIYLLCGLAIVASIVTLAIDNLSGELLSSRVPRLTYYGEATALVAFGISWLTASHWLPIIASKRERSLARNQRAVQSEPAARAE